MTSHLWLRLDPNGPLAEERATDDGGGCAVTAREPAPTSHASTMAALGLGLVGLALVRARRRTRR